MTEVKLGPQGGREKGEQEWGRRGSHGIWGSQVLTHCLLWGEGPSRPDPGLDVGPAPWDGLMGLGAPGLLGSLDFRAQGLWCPGAALRNSVLWLSRFWGVQALALQVLWYLGSVLSWFGAVAPSEFWDPWVWPGGTQNPELFPCRALGAPQNQHQPQDPPFHPSHSQSMEVFWEKVA